MVHGTVSCSDSYVFNVTSWSTLNLEAGVVINGDGKWACISVESGATCSIRGATVSNATIAVYLDSNSSVSNPTVNVYDNSTLIGSNYGILHWGNSVGGGISGYTGRRFL